jgi:hypothetical protein
MAGKMWPRLYLLGVDGRTIALYRFFVAGRFSFYQSGMDPAWAKANAGMIMLRCSIEHTIETERWA